MNSAPGARIYTAHRGWLGVVTGISATSTAWGRSSLEKFKEHMISVTAMDMAFIAN